MIQALSLSQRDPLIGMLASSEQKPQIGSDRLWQTCNMLQAYSVAANVSVE